MAKYCVLLLIVRLVLPASLLLSIALRPFGLSIIYLLLYLLSPFTQVPDSRTFRGFRGTFLLLIMLISSCLFMVHLAWHSTLAFFPPYGSLVDGNQLLQLIVHNLGLVKYAEIAPLMAVQYIAPELIMTVASLFVYLAARKLTSGGDPTDEKRDTTHQQYPKLTSAGKYVALFLIMFSGIMRPSVTSGVYFLVFMGATTVWALGKPLEKGFAVVARCLMAVMAAHASVLIAYQCSPLIEGYPPEEPYSRYFGLTRLITINGTTNSFSYVVEDEKQWSTLASPLVILITYYFLGIESRELFKPKLRKKSALTGLEAGMSNGSLIRGISFRRGSRRTITRDKWKSATMKARVAYDYIDSKTLRRRASFTETSPLIRNVSPSKRWPSVRSASGPRALQQDSMGSVHIPDEESMMDLEPPTLLDDIIAAVIDFFQVLIRSSYIATTVTMMAWSIMFHSWLSFVFLMWGNVVWLCQNQRSFMLKTSPLLVIYAMMLLICQYIYSMDLTETELPSNITEVNLRQIGLSRPDVEAFIPLLIKSLFTCMFWVTLRQRVHEVRHRRRSAVVAELAAPLQLTVSTAASAIETQQEEAGRSRLLHALGKWLAYFCARYWIYVVVIMLFVIGITGERMTIFRIIYMFLFLAFILMFQISWTWWRKLMYLFWIIVIIYSMINLILLYIYQFDNFSKTISDYLLIGEQLQRDLGLDTYKPADLFVKLLTPTLFLIMTIMQVHYFHKDFMRLSDPLTRSNSVRDVASSRPSQAASTMKDDLPALPLEDDAARPPPSPGALSIKSKNSTELDVSLNLDPDKSRADRKVSRSRSYAATMTERPSTSFRVWAGEVLRQTRGLVLKAVDKVFIYLEIHLVRIIFIALMLLSVLNVCAMHVPIMLMIAPASVLSWRQQRLIILIISTLISGYLMANMVYQIQYIQHDSYNINCTSANSSANETTYNNAEWIGFRKATAAKPLASLMKGYIALIAVFTFYSLVTYRQQNIRGQSVVPKHKYIVMFPDITRVEADKDVVHCIKYLFNYCFYKFGVEITLICMMGVIGSRMDVYALLYAMWLMTLVCMPRVRQARVWGAFTACVTVLVPAQYIIAVGVIPQLCLLYPWSGDTEQIKHIRTWLFLPYPDSPPHATKLIFDFFLLMFASLQLKVFWVERSDGKDYPGGDNAEDSGNDWETPNFVNAVPDFLGYIGSWLDVIKRLVFLGMLWVSLAIMFLTGTNRVNLFSMGYLIGSFIFLWQGTDFYLRPKTTILRWWSWLVRYNVCVVVIKTLLQIPGCIFSSVMQERACWLVQLLGIGCVDKFAGGNISQFIRMDYVKDAICSVPQEDIGLAWDGVCFAFLILQRRLFHSYYFYRVIDESKATTVLASRGAELIEELRIKQMEAQEEQETKILEKIKVKMERIKANQKKIEGTLAKEPDMHHDREDDDIDEEEDVDDEEMTQIHAESEKVPLVRGDSDASGRGFHTPESPASPRGFHTPVSEHSAPPTPPPAPHPAPPSPSSALLTSVSLDAYLEPRRISFSSPPGSELLPRAKSPEDSYPVFSPPPRRRHTLASPSLLQRTSVISASSRAEPHSHHTYDRPKYSAPTSHVRAVRSGDYYMFDEFDDTDVQIQDDDESSEDEDGAFKEMGIGKGRRRPSRHELLRPRESDPRVTVDGPEGEEESELDQYASQPVKETLFEKVQHILSTAWVFICSFVVSVTRHVIKLSRDYRYVSRTLAIEKKILKETLGFGIGLRERPHMVWEPLPEALVSHQLKDLSTLEDQDDSMFRQNTSPFVHLGYALWYAILAHTDIVCYIMVFINQIQSATILSIPLPMMVFLWGTLTIPRPTKTFWVTLIAYTEVIVLLKSMFQFEILPWNQKVIPANMPFTAPRIIGIERKSDYALFDLLLLLIIFLHRFMLKSLGLWKESSPDVELHDDMEFRLTSEDTQLVAAGRAAEVGRKYVQLADKMGPATGKNASDRSATPVLDEAESEYHDNDDEAGPSKPTDDDHYKVNDDQEPIIQVTTTLEAPYQHFPHVVVLSVKRYLRPVHTFFRRMLAPGARVTADVYAYMFLCDFANFLVVIFGFAAFGTHQGDGGVQAYLEENKVPIPFLVMLILQFALIVIDRALYLRKFMLGKILFQYALIIGVHVWMFFVLPFITERTFNALLPPPMWYMMKCIYLLLSAYQIRCGYPRRIIGNFLCKSYRFLNMVLFRCFMAVPFVFELRTLMDWIWTDSSMTLMDWLKMEDIFANVFLLKCGRQMEDKFPQPRGSKKSTTIKYLLGGGVLAFVIAIIWFPLVFFAFGNTVGEPNPPKDVTVKIRIGPFLPVYQMSAQSHNIDLFQEWQYTKLSYIYRRDRTAQTFLSNYMYNDIAVVTINPNSTMKWGISPPELDRLEREAASNASMTVKFTFVITHLSNAAQNPPTIEDSREVSLEAYIDGHKNPEREKLLRLLAGNATDDTWMNVKQLFPKFVKVFNKGEAKPAYQLMPDIEADKDSRLYRDVQLRLERDRGDLYWRVREGCGIEDALNNSNIPMNNCDMLVVYTFNDKLFPATLNFISGSGIIGLYTTFVFLASRVLRGFFSGIYTKIMFDDLPNVDRVLQLCLDIYLVREALELTLEEDLFAKLVFLYRSPETMIKWSRPKEDEGEEQRALPPSR